jgi:hypothetical protein
MELNLVLNRTDFILIYEIENKTKTQRTILKIELEVR